MIGKRNETKMIEQLMIRENDVLKESVYIVKIGILQELEDNSGYILSEDETKMTSLKTGEESIVCDTHKKRMIISEIKLEDIKFKCSNALISQERLNRIICNYYYIKKL